MPEYFSYKDAMKYMELKTQDTLRAYIADGLPTIHVGNKKRISKTAIDEFMKAHTVVATQNK